MILISSITKDEATANIIDWLIYYNEKFIRINETDILNIKVEINNKEESVSLYEKNKHINLCDINSYWYRRGNFQIKNQLLPNKNSVTKIINNYVLDESEHLSMFLHDATNEIISINSYHDTYINKLCVLKKAKQLGIRIPDTLITSDKKDLKEFYQKHENIISKPIREGLSFILKNINYYLHTNKLTQKDIEDFPEKFSHMLFQNEVEKKYELRIFYLFGKFYASAIFSQNDPKTKIDFRNYNEDKPNRVVPYILPSILKKKLHKLLTSMKLNSGSLDIIVDKNDEYIFLEVNPIGQFAQVSKPCNYYLEKLIAQRLISYDRRNKN